ncbi:unnamed protein product [Discosporangium mesarthrocarpum]
MLQETDKPLRRLLQNTASRLGDPLSDDCGGWLPQGGGWSPKWGAPLFSGKVERNLWKVLKDSGYLLSEKAQDLTDNEQRMGEYWFNYVFRGVIGARSERVIDLANAR